MFKDFYKNKKVFVTGHTGFKGAWLCLILNHLGAEVIGYSLKPPTEISLFDLCDIKKLIKHIDGDIRDIQSLKKALIDNKPEIVIHMAAQPLVRDSYENPVYTYETNVIGTVNVCESVRFSNTVRSFVNVTTDKVYNNKERLTGYKEDEELKGRDPYSNSKSCSELVTYSYKKSFFDDNEIAVSTCRAGNVIGGGDFAKDRIIPDCVRAIETSKDLIIRNPNSIRPYQHVFEPLMGYLLVAQKQYEDNKLSDYYNIGPDEEGCLTTLDLVDRFGKSWNDGINCSKFSWKVQSDSGPHEAGYLKLNCNKIKRVLGWQQKWGIDQAVDSIVDWTKVYLNHGNVKDISFKQIDDYLGK